MVFNSPMLLVFIVKYSLEVIAAATFMLAVIQRFWKSAQTRYPANLRTASLTSLKGRSVPVQIRTSLVLSSEILLMLGSVHDSKRECPGFGKLC